MDKAQIKAVIAARAAKELKDGDIVNLGIGIPTLIPTYLPEGVNIQLQAECGMINAGGAPAPEDAEPAHICDAGGSPASILTGGAFIDSSMSFTMIRGGHVNGTFLGALQVDEKGNLATVTHQWKNWSGKQFEEKRICSCDEEGRVVKVVIREEGNTTEAREEYVINYGDFYRFVGIR